MIARLLRRLVVQRYANPYLHEGYWSTPKLLGYGEQTRVRWDSLSGNGWIRQAFEPGHVHEPIMCTIGPGMAHEDECLCGAKRFGVFGVWE